MSTEGDSFFAVFIDPVTAVRTASDIQMELAQRSPGWSSPVKVRLGLHSGIGMLGGDNYIGVDVHKASRIESAAHGGETLMSDGLGRLVRAEFGEESHDQSRPFPVAGVLRGRDASQVWRCRV